jgi:hypothetical protein
MKTYRSQHRTSLVALAACALALLAVYPDTPRTGLMDHIPTGLTPMPYDPPTHAPTDQSGY